MNPPTRETTSPVVDAFDAQRQVLLSFAEQHDLQLFLYAGALHVRSCYDIWQIVAGEDDIIKLYHRNSKDSPWERSDSSILGYHRQCTEAVTLKEMLLYIWDHDRYREARGARRLLPLDEPRAWEKAITVYPRTPRPWEMRPVTQNARCRHKRHAQNQHRTAEINNVYRLIDALVSM